MKRFFQLTALFGVVVAVIIMLSGCSTTANSKQKPATKSTMYGIGPMGGPIYDVNPVSYSGPTTSNKYPIVHLDQAIDTSSLTNINVGSVNVTNTVTIQGNIGITNAATGTNAASAVHVTNDYPVSVNITNEANGTTAANAIFTTNEFLVAISNLTWTLTQSVHPTAGTNQVGGFSVACTNAVTIATNAHTVGMVITSGESTNFFRVNGGGAWLQTFTWLQFGQTNADNKILWCFSRPITAVTNNALWGPTDADMMYLCSSPLKIGCSTNEVTPFGTVGFAQSVSQLARPMVNTWTNRELYWVLTQDTVANAGYTSNAVTTARVRISGFQD